ncbi:MAG: hypothetical protein PHY43_09815 [Verrucomicrobiales bacterium]|nr:hypothetical protein [Verrucomicrobiales bacterium]
MTLHHIIGLAATAVFFYALWIGLLGLTYILLDLFMDWYQQFKQARKNKDAKNNQGGVAK